MKTLSSLFLILIILSISGCASKGSALKSSKLESLTHIHIVPIEDPPLHIGDFETQDKVGKAIMLPLLFFHPFYGGPIGMAAVIQEEMVDQPRRKRQLSKIHDSVIIQNKNNSWALSAETARETMHQLETANDYSISIDPEIKRLPGLKQSKRMDLIENWEPYRQAWRKWYNMESSSFDYSGQPGSGAVLEIGILEHSFAHSSFFFRLAMKLIDPVSSSVIENSECRFEIRRNHNELEKLFQNNGTEFKKLILEYIKFVIPECLEDLELRSEIT